MVKILYYILLHIYKTAFLPKWEACFVCFNVKFRGLYTQRLNKLAERFCEKGEEKLSAAFRHTGD